MVQCNKDFDPIEWQVDLGGDLAGPLNDTVNVAAVFSLFESGTYTDRGVTEVAHRTVHLVLGTFR
jgi:hypothetical protein